MSLKIGINGFGRIGRNILRAIYENKRNDIEIVMVNDLGSIETNAHLLRYDSVHGRFPDAISVSGDRITIGDGKASFRVSAVSDPACIPWEESCVDIVMECTGRFTVRDKAAAHLNKGVKKVIVSAPCEAADMTVVYGVNHHRLQQEHIVISNASCTTNCLAPLAMILHETVGIEKGMMTTVHSYTGDQPILDTMHKDLYRARCATMSQIPTSTGAAKAIGIVLPELAGKLDGISIRVPTPNVSLVDFKFLSMRKTNIEEINDALVKASLGGLKGILSVTSHPNVSIDFNHDPHSSTVALDQTKVTDGDFISVLSWYDNEWGFSNRMADVAVSLAKTF